MKKKSLAGQNIRVSETLIVWEVDLGTPHCHTLYRLSSSLITYPIHSKILFWHSDNKENLSDPIELQKSTSYVTIGIRSMRLQSDGFLQQIIMCFMLHLQFCIHLCPKSKLWGTFLVFVFVQGSVSRAVGISWLIWFRNHQIIVLVAKISLQHSCSISFRKSHPKKSRHIIIITLSSPDLGKIFYCSLDVKSFHINEPLAYIPPIGLVGWCVDAY